MTMRNLLIGSLLLCIAGCGCNEDSFPPGTSGLISAGVLGVGFEAPRLPVDPTPNAVVPIDIVFVLDDSNLFNTFPLPPVPDNPLDRRPRSFAAQRIFNHLRAQVEMKLKTAIDDAVVAGTLPAGIDPATFKDQLDFAFAVARYEDFGGPFTRSAFDDGDARPFILNMPLTRAKLPTFDAAFAGALARPAPGDGNITPMISGKDPQTGIEALYQIAEGTGFDGNGLNGTNESGAAGSDMAQRVPGTSGDVPAIRFGPAAQDPQDPARPIYPLLDTNGTDTVMADHDNNPATAPIPVMAAGNVGGVGWRPSSARFVILAGDIATVAPTGAANAGYVPANDPAYPGAQIQKILSTAGAAGAAGAPRAAAGVPLSGFDAVPGPGVRAGIQWPRIGPAETTKEGRNVGVLNGYAGVAPLGAHTVEETIVALNNRNIEVICLAAPDQIPGHTKPGLGDGTNVNGDQPDDILNFISDVNAFLPTITPWTWMTGIGRLTGAVDPIQRTRKGYRNATPTTVEIANDPTDPASWITFDNNYLASPVFDPAPAANTGAIEVGHLALVYNLATVWTYDPALPNSTTGNEALIKDDVVDDLVERTMEWIKGGHLGTTAGGPTMPTLPEPIYEFTLELMYPETTQLTHTPVGTKTTAGGIVTETFEVKDVKLPVYYVGAAAPALPRVNFFLPDSLSFTPKAEVAETIPLPWSEQVAFKVTGRLVRIDNQTAANADQVAQLKEKIMARGNGELFECTAEPGIFGTTPLGLETDPVTFAQGVLEMIVRLETEPGSGARIVLMEHGQVIVEDLSIGGIPGEQIAGGQPFPDAQPEPFGCDTEAPTITCPSNVLGAGHLGTEVPAGPTDLTALVSATDNRYPEADLAWTFRDLDTNAIIIDTMNFTVAEGDQFHLGVEVADPAGNVATCDFWVYGPPADNMPPMITACPEYDLGIPDPANSGVNRKGAELHLPRLNPPMLTNVDLLAYLNAASLSLHKLTATDDNTPPGMLTWTFTRLDEMGNDLMVLDTSTTYLVGLFQVRADVQDEAGNVASCTFWLRAWVPGPSSN